MLCVEENLRSSLWVVVVLHLAVSFVVNKRNFNVFFTLVRKLQTRCSACERQKQSKFQFLYLFRRLRERKYITENCMPQKLISHRFWTQCTGAFRCLRAADIYWRRRGAHRPKGALISKQIVVVAVAASHRRVVAFHRDRRQKVQRMRGASSGRGDKGRRGAEVVRAQQSGALLGTAAAATARAAGAAGRLGR